MTLPEEEYVKLLKVQAKLLESEHKNGDFYGLLKEITQLVVKKPELALEKADTARMQDLFESTVKYLLSITDMQYVDSSNIKKIGYDQDTQHLFVEFISEDLSLYRYFDVEENVFDAFTKAESKGKFFHKFIRGKYEDERIG